MKRLSLAQAASAIGFESGPVPGATPKKPFSGFTARRRPSTTRSQAMSSPHVSIVQPGMDAGGVIMAMLVFPHAEGKAAHT